jgi:hypothetical protein
MIVGYKLSGHDNDSYMLGEETRRTTTSDERVFFDWRFIQNGEQHPATCPKCGRKIDPNYINPHFRLRKKSMDIGSTYDGYTIVSNRFMEFCIAIKLTGVEFVPLPSQPDHYWFRVHNSLKVDRENSVGLRLMNFCDGCQTYAGVFGTSGLRFSDVKSTIPSGIFRTDLEFSQAHEQHPIFLVDTNLAALLKIQKFKGLCLSELSS